MPYEIEFTTQAIDSLKTIPKPARVEIVSAIETILTNSPSTQTRRIKRLRKITNPDYRLRVADYRVFYNVIESKVTVVIIEVLEDGPAHKWYKVLEAEGKE